MLTLDHVAISGVTRDAATEYVEEALGVPLQPGGEHGIFHTHNTLLGLEDGLYLEAIAINPQAPRPDRARWFDLDRFAGPARLTNWICAVPDLAEIGEKLPFDIGQPTALTRGDLRWQMAVPVDGALAYDNCAPALMAWEGGDHPATRLNSQGVRLLQLTVRHPRAEELARALEPVLDDARIAFETAPAGLQATFETPHGRRALNG